MVSKHSFLAFAVVAATSLGLWKFVGEGIAQKGGGFRLQDGRIEFVPPTRATVLPECCERDAGLLNFDPLADWHGRYANLSNHNETVYDGHWNLRAARNGVRALPAMYSCQVKAQ
jgi:hypothetical protein